MPSHQFRPSRQLLKTALKKREQPTSIAAETFSTKCAINFPSTSTNPAMLRPMATLPCNGSAPTSPPRCGSSLNSLLLPQLLNPSTTTTGQTGTGVSVHQKAIRVTGLGSASKTLRSPRVTKVARTCRLVAASVVSSSRSSILALSLISRSPCSETTLYPSLSQLSRRLLPPSLFSEHLSFETAAGCSGRWRLQTG